LLRGPGCDGCGGRGIPFGEHGWGRRRGGDRPTWGDLTVTVGLYLLKVDGDVIVVVFVQVVMVRPGVIQPCAALALKGRPNEGSLTGKGMEFGVKTAEASGLSVSATLNFFHFTQGRVHIGFNGLKELMGPLELPDLLVTETGDPGYLHLQMRALLRRRRRGRRKDSFRSFDLRLKPLHSIVGIVKPNVEQTLS
jgi:hypothetical protein